ncbi:MAG: CDP-diacylglycerol--glycerol-3-phosphate 3-phosphatidyltransferase/cardiolipin synthase [Methylophilaceae bacterium]|jgi:CDP-diacylglycerol--glycerol-3-phosphate 3-phosphatidyltransferase/cardiolipin synthase|tara:strand:- start:133 stop:720 length:588 start_codon:yes stop_codon:yes gene_type:complete
MFWNVPNILTVLRIALIPVFVGIFYLPHNTFALGIQPTHTLNLIAASVFALASFTDWLDGYWARKYNQTSAFGAFLDPVADKLMVAAALIVLVEFDRVGAVVSLIIIGREIAISGLREWMATIGKSSNVAVAMVGKIKTAAQMLAILLLLYFDPVGSFDTALVGTVLIYVGAILTLVSMGYYLKAAWPIIKDSFE